MRAWRLGAGVLLVIAFAALGTWQIERRTWKQTLIARVQARLRAPAASAPGPASWPAMTGARDEYRRVAVRGTFLHAAEVRVQALTSRGAGAWVVTPLRTRGFTLLVNRGFVPADPPVSVIRPRGEVAVIGLLRLTEPGGGFLRANDPAAGRWYSRDVAAIARSGGIGDAAPYFVDAAASGRGYPVGGLTVVAFTDHHLAYALTWFALAVLAAGATVVAARR